MATASRHDTAPSIAVPRLHRSIYPERKGEGSLLDGLLRKSISSDGTDREASKQEVGLARQDHPFNLVEARNLLVANEHHSTCINAKVAATVGLGHQTQEQRAMMEARRQQQAEGLMTAPESFVSQMDWKPSKVDEKLDPLCEFSWADTLWAAGEDFYEVGSGFIEVIRESPKDNAKIVGISHIPAHHVFVFVENRKHDFHYEIVGSGDFSPGKVQRFCRYGELERFLERAKKAGESGSANFQIESPEAVSEVIHIRRPNSRSRWYGFPTWLSAVPSIELAQMVMQHNFDFFLNRGVPEFMLFLIGAKLAEPEWKVIEDAIKAGIGHGNSHKSLASNLPYNPNEFSVQVERLGMEDSGENKFGDMKEANALSIVSAHQVPPLLAGIQIPGKLGAVNELPNALMAFQALVIGQNQRLWQRTLGRTLGSGNNRKGGQLGLEAKDFVFRRITEEIDIGHMDTVARMRQSPAQAKAEGRDLNSGVKD